VTRDFVICNVHKIKLNCKSTTYLRDDDDDDDVYKSLIGKYEEQKYFGDLDVNVKVATEGIKSDGVMM
jgi:hypothetical protein